MRRKGKKLRFFVVYLEAERLEGTPSQRNPLVMLNPELLLLLAGEKDDKKIRHLLEVARQHRADSGFLSALLQPVRHLIPRLILTLNSDPEIADFIDEVEREVLFTRKSILGVPSGGIIQSGKAIEHLSTFVGKAREVRFRDEPGWIGDYPIAVRVLKGRYFLNAFWAIWGRIYIGEGLLRQVQCAEEFLAILGHEIAHGENVHSAPDASIFLVFLATALESREGRTNSGLLHQVEEFVDGILSKRSHEHEYHADQGGIDVLHHLGLPLQYLELALKHIDYTQDPLPADIVGERRTVAERLRRYRDLNKKVKVGKLTVPYDTHPDTADRVRHSQEYIAAKGWGEHYYGPEDARLNALYQTILAEL